MSLARFKALQFDCYGVSMSRWRWVEILTRNSDQTLIDWEKGMLAAAGALTDTRLDRTEFMTAFGAAQRREQRDRPAKLYSDVLKAAYLPCAAQFGLPDDPDHASNFAQSVPEWPPFPDSPAALRRLSQLGLKLVVLSNVDNRSFAGTRTVLETAGGFRFHAVYTAEDIGSYKPDLNNFQYAVEHIEHGFGIKQDEVLVVANSKFHDVAPGSEIGLKTAWIARSRAIMGVSGYEGAEPTYTYPSMEAFAAAMAEARDQKE